MVNDKDNVNSKIPVNIVKEPVGGLLAINKKRTSQHIIVAMYIV